MRIPNMMVVILALFFSSTAFAEDVQAVGAEAQVSTMEPSIERGKMIFDTVCIHCHHTDSKVGSTGCPGLKGVLGRHDEVWLDKWLLAPEEFSKIDVKAKAVVDGNPYGLVMPILPEMQDKQNRKDMIEFLKTLK
ncbi:MAG: c-type cytochrome [Mariprofundaceae bacterium]|nr:c-type cytochrome [Mariprofundaceae bacterium]